MNCAMLVVNVKIFFCQKTAVLKGLKDHHLPAVEGVDHDRDSELEVFRQEPHLPSVDSVM